MYLLVLVHFEVTLLAAATDAKFPGMDTCSVGEPSLSDGGLLGVLLTSTGCCLLFGVDVALLQLEFNAELLVLFKIVLVALTAVGLTG